MASSFTLNDNGGIYNGQLVAPQQLCLFIKPTLQEDEQEHNRVVYIDLEKNILTEVAKQEDFCCVSASSKAFDSNLIFVVSTRYGSLYFISRDLIEQFQVSEEVRNLLDMDAIPLIQSVKCINNQIFMCGASGTFLAFNGNVWTILDRHYLSIAQEMDRRWLATVRGRSVITATARAELERERMRFDFFDLDGLHEDDIYLVGAMGTIGHWNGKNLTLLPPSTTKHLTKVYVSDTNDVWIFGPRQVVLRGNSSGFHNVDLHRFNTGTARSMCIYEEIPYILIDIDGNSVLVKQVDGQTTEVAVPLMRAVLPAHTIGADHESLWIIGKKGVLLKQKGNWKLVFSLQQSRGY